MVHVSEMAEGFVRSPGDDVTSVGQEVEVRVIKKSGRPRQIDLSMKMLQLTKLRNRTKRKTAKPKKKCLRRWQQAFQRAMEGARMNAHARVPKAVQRASGPVTARAARGNSGAYLKRIDNLSQILTAGV